MLYFWLTATNNFIIFYIIILNGHWLLLSTLKLWLQDVKETCQPHFVDFNICTTICQCLKFGLTICKFSNNDFIYFFFFTYLSTNTFQSKVNRYNFANQNNIQSVYLYIINIFKNVTEITCLIWGHADMFGRGDKLQRIKIQCPIFWVTSKSSRHDQA